MPLQWLYNFLFILGLQRFHHAMLFPLLFCYCPQAPKALFIFSTLFSSSLDYSSTFELTDDFSYNLYSVKKPIKGILILVILFFSSRKRFPKFSFIISLFFLTSLSIIIIAALKSLSAYSNIWIISWLISVEFFFFWDQLSTYWVLLYCMPYIEKIMS